ncbi:nicotinate-nucleotide--dimethylbenzimidazole phosphoribosyltransferase [Streptomyces sp. M92]|uniref:nicotinate-nucleotide--dimethylbenzimidazole phosphoribosyltransferase n=1 Tax=Streptomyces sp. M92 TaxID=2944250 RepID=UPI002349F4B8|nr:nicotinate-nucleotide--dimethylbenzimidazole phosphoribosyltransferase [Streptomyces sp. M92]WCN06406.1 nicotinate-nucleotide--dimethylbenzimidazole phosphoribosyltransferase [Streptomyces sp. M92]
MTDTGQIPGEGLPENAGMVEQPGVPAPGAYTYLSETTAEDEDLLLLPGAQSAWGNEVAPPAPEPVVETVHQPGPHEMSGRDSGSVDLSGVRPSEPSPQPASVPAPPRRPLHLGPPIPDTSASPVRSLADRGPADAPVRHAGPPAAGPEYLDAAQTAATPPQGAAPWGPAQAAPQAQQPAEVPVGAGAVRAETVIPVADQAAQPVGAAEALVTRVATEAVAATGGEPGESGQSGGPGEPEVPAADTHAGVPDPALSAPGDADGAGSAPGAEAAHVQGTPEGGDGTRKAVAEPAAEEETAPEAVAAPRAEEAPEPDAVTERPADEAPAPGAVPGHEAEQMTQAALPETGAGEAVEPAPTPQAGPEEPVAVPAQPVAEAAGQPVAAVAQDVSTPEGVAPEAVPVAEPAVDPEAVQDDEPGEAADAAQTVESADAQEPAQTVEPADGQGPAQTVESADAQDPAQAVEPTGAPEAAQEGEPTRVPGAEQAAGADQAPEPVQTVTEPSEAVQLVPSAEPSEAVQPVPLAEPSEAVQPVPSAEPSEAAQPVPSAEPTEAAQPAPPTRPSEVAEPAAQPAEPVEVPEPQDVPPAEARVTGAARTGALTEADLAPGEPAGHEPSPETAAADGQPAPAPEATAPSESSPQPVPVAGDRPHADVRAAAAQDGAVAQPAAREPDHPAADAQPAQGPQSVAGTYAAPGTDVALEAEAPQTAPEPAVAAAASAGGVQPHPDQPVGQFVPVDGGQVPTTPHLAPTPPEALVVPPETWDTPATQEAPEPVAPVPAPREADPEVAQNAEDLDTRADQEGPEDPEDVSTAAEADARRSTGPAAPAYADAEREAVLKVMRERRDIRNGFRSDPIPHEVLLRVLEAAHTAPSVGHSQPWDFVVIRSADTRRAMHELATRQRDAYAKSLPKGRAKQFKELKIEAILDTPVNIVVTADPTRGGRHTLGRHTQPQMAPYSSALAVENLWLAARAEGLGVGWVSFFDEREMVRALGLPEHLDVVAYLCVGYVDEFPDEPELMQAGWSKRRPLSWVVHEETYGRRALPGEEPHDLLAETVAQIRPLDAKALGEAWERQKRMTKPAGALGMLEIISAQLSGLSRQCPPPIPEPAAVAVFAGDHGVHAQGVTPWPQEVTAQMVANFLGGGAVCNAFATQVGAEVCVVDVGVATDLPATPGLLPRKVRAGTSDMTAGPAMTREEAKQAIEVGIETARDLVAAGNKALLTGEMGIANTTASAALISVFTGADPAEVTGRGTGINDETLARKTEVVRRALEVHQPDPADPIGVLAAVGGFEHAAMVGLLLGGASLRTPVILDGVSAGAAALVARAIAPEVLAACIAGHRSAEPGHVAALNKLGLRPLVDLDLRLGEGTGALLALPMVQSTARAMHEVATFDSAGVTEK